MAILPLITAPDPLLKQKSLWVNEIDHEIRKLMKDMLETMYHDKGVGLAAVQVGVLKRVIVIDLQDDETTERPKNFYPLYIANPEILEQSGELVTAVEGCLSVPEQRVEVPRPASVKIRFLDHNNVRQELASDGWLARVIQHEMDHLEGRLLIDYLSSLRRDIVVRKLKKLKTQKRCL